ncbi:fungal-specific transcription factor domain-containing protein [Amylocarpus encephaloides]|uniref:Fungal-specific transcription factor domain-containing protein n=1 Tax=Amylocarpus encephaloides TaxID=45428 RepID=A0A9P8C666_9HELO|nr:fungal-specific transcription factor domain-containing protein [Amylocarpus encephaloides]
METITIPSPTSFLASPVIKPAPEPPPFPKRQTTAATRSAISTKRKTGIVKPKQSKSRNGCVTCKAKRLKCDETKPECQQCHKRSVVCGGYKKDFKWRPFEETTVASKVVPQKSKDNSVESGKQPELTTAPVPAPVPAPKPVASPMSESSSTPGVEAEGDMSMEGSFFHAAAPTPQSFSPLPDTRFDHPPFFDMNTPPYMRELPRPRFEADSVTKSLSSLFEDANSAPSNSSTRPSFSGQSPSLMDLLLPGSELNARPGSVSIPPLSLSIPSSSMSPIDPQFLPPVEMTRDSMMDDDVEEIVRGPQMSDSGSWLARSPIYFGSRSPTPPSRMQDDPFNKIYRQPEVQAGSPEMLMLRFDKQTCGILSVKDGPTENPWRTLIWPLARDSPALYHAIASMTAFHTSKERPTLRVDGMEHMRRSIRSLATGIESMRTDTALATTLVLAFSESWDQHISTGIEHLRGAKILVNQALISHRKNNLSGDDLSRLRFLCNTWVYMDVIARLTSVDDESADSDHYTSLNMPSFPNNNEIDPLMGCASTLFPLVGRVANLCRRVRMANSTSIQMISQAIELKGLIELWSPPPGSAFERPEDPTSEIQHALQTAEAYRFATLLYLHQAVPEIPSLTSAQLAKKVLIFLATVPLSSRLVIVQIYPLLAAGCEAYDREDRQWVEDRWRNMMSRMWIGNIDRCWEVMEEVWSRRDAAEIAQAERENQRRPRHDMMIHSELNQRKFEEEMAMEDIFSFSDMLNTNIPGGSGRQKARSGMNGQAVAPQNRRQEPTTEEMDPEVTVRGRMHWVGVMKDWDWESRFTVLFFANLPCSMVILSNSFNHNSNQAQVLLG